MRVYEAILDQIGLLSEASSGEKKASTAASIDSHQIVDG